MRREAKKVKSNARVLRPRVKEPRHIARAADRRIWRKPHKEKKLLYTWKVLSTSFVSMWRPKQLGLWRVVGVDTIKYRQFRINWMGLKNLIKPALFMTFSNLYTKNSWRTNENISFNKEISRVRIFLGGGGWGGSVCRITVRACAFIARLDLIQISLYRKSKNPLIKTLRKLPCSLSLKIMLANRFVFFARIFSSISPTMTWFYIPCMCMVVSMGNGKYNIL